MVEGIPVFGKVSLFAGRRWNARPGSVRLPLAGFLPPEDTHRRQRMSEGRRGGERRRRTPSSVRNQPRLTCLGSVTRPSLGPSTRARRSSLTPRASSVVGRRRGHRGRANLRKREEPAPGFTKADGARLAAGHRFRKGAAWLVRKGRRSWPSSLRGSRAPVGLPARRNTQLQKSAGECRVSNKPEAHLQKGEAGRVNGDLGRRQLRDESLGEGIVSKGRSTSRS